MNTDEIFMQRALDLAKNGLGYVSPNPLVGCVVVCDEKIIGEGWHQQYGGAHAEVHAINAVQDQQLLTQSTVYVNLEPCAHFGKTPPCADLLIGKSVKKVVIANKDPNPKVNGGGIKKLQEAGIEVAVGVCEEQGLALNRRFFTYIIKNRPYVMLKWAQTADGFVARENYDSTWISNTSSRKLVHKWRSEETAILVGYQTAKYDDPQLNVRDWGGKNPLRLVIDRDLTLPDTLKLFDRTQPTICYNQKLSNRSENLEMVKFGNNQVQEILQDLYRREVQSVIIEGGAATLNQFIACGLWDEARVFIAKKTFGRGIAAPKLNKNIFAQEMIIEDRLLLYKNV